MKTTTASSQHRPQPASAPGRPRNPQPATMPASSASAPPLHPTPRGLASLPPRPRQGGVLASARRAKNIHGFAQGLVSVPAPPDVQEMLAARKREEELEERGGQLPIRENDSIKEWDEAPTESSETSGTTTSWAARNRATAKWVGDLPGGVALDPNLASEGQQPQDIEEGPEQEGSQDEQPDEQGSNQVDDYQRPQPLDEEREYRLEQKRNKQREARRRKTEQKRREHHEARQRAAESVKQEEPIAATADWPTLAETMPVCGSNQPQVSTEPEEAVSRWDLPYHDGANEAARSSKVAPAESSAGPAPVATASIRWPNPPPKPEEARSEWDRPYHDTSPRNKTPYTASLLDRLGPPPPPAAAPTNSSSMQSVELAPAPTTATSTSAWDEPYVPPSDDGQSRKQPTKKPYPKKGNRPRNGGAGGEYHQHARPQQQGLQATAAVAATGWD